MDLRTPGDPKLSLFARQLGELKKELIRYSPALLADRTGSEYHLIAPDLAEFRLRVWEQDVRVMYPAFEVLDLQTGKVLALASQAFILYYFKTADGTSASGRWISFSELPDGKFYNQAYQGYSGLELSRAFRTDLGAFEQIAQKLGGERLSSDNTQTTPGDSAYRFRALPRVNLLVVYWRGDEDFPASFQILFDASVSHYLPTDVCAILGSTLTRKIISAKRSNL